LILQPQVHRSAFRRDPLVWERGVVAFNVGIEAPALLPCLWVYRCVKRGLSAALFLELIRPAGKVKRLV
jgi:hypothetical protein